MNDFLQSIRNGNYAKENGSSKPRYNSQRPRRTYESNGNFTRNGNERKFHQRSGGDNVPDETMTAIKETLAAILTNQKSTLSFSERRAIAEERKADAFEFIATHIGKLSGEIFVPQIHAAETPQQIVADDSAPVEEQKETQGADTQETDTQAINNDSDDAESSDLGKDDIMELIASMRREGSTYNEIASHLVDLNLPTFSGRGKWHAQTIHRLCQSI
ncbi:MAG: hypothetical protein KKD44_06935 [Proteobacteria bacterium]|nr:hypothetical protein [Pseudomonadota bacterium]